MFKLLNFIIIIIVSLQIYHVTAVKTRLEADVISLEPFHVDKKKFNISLKTTRISRGVIGMSEHCYINDDMDTYKVYTTVYRSTYGNNQYIRLAFGSVLGGVSFEYYMNNIYKKLFMHSVSTCSNLPQFEGDYKPPFGTGLLWGNSCLIKSSDIPPFIQEGYYKYELLFLNAQDSGFGTRAILKVFKYAL